MFHTYIDWTTDNRPFYVGMGDNTRVSRRLGRNKHHARIVKKHGLVRKIVKTFVDRQSAIELEIKLIAEYHTFVDDDAYNGIGCNYTKGGEGCACSQETRTKISKSQRGKAPWNKGKRGLTYNLTKHQRQKARERLIALNKSLRPMLGKHHSNETKSRMRKPHACSVCNTLGHTKTTCPNQKLP